MLTTISLTSTRTLATKRFSSSFRREFSTKKARTLSTAAEVEFNDDEDDYEAPSDDHGVHYEQPDAPDSEFQISYTLSPMKIEKFPAKLSNFQNGKAAYERMVLDGNKDQVETYVDPNANKLFETIFPEIVESRRIGKIQESHFETWNYRDDPDQVLLQRAFRMIDRDQNGTIEKEELDAVLKRAGLTSKAEDAAMFDKIDKDGSGSIDMEEFQEFWKKSSFSKESGAMQRLGKGIQDFLEGIAKPLVENNVEILFKPKDLPIDEHTDFLAVGGPSTYAAAVIHKAQYPEQSIFHVVGHRFDSNADGSAYYYHERDAFPLYVNKVNTGWYCVYADLNKRLRSKASLRDLCVQDRHHVKIALNWAGLLAQPWMIFSIFIPNTYHAFSDLVMKKPKDSLMAQACLHSQRVPKIVETACEKLGLPKRAFLVRDPSRAVYIDVEGRKRAGDHFDWLNQYADIPYHSLDPSVFGPLVTEVLGFNRDGALNPWMFENFHSAFDKLGIKSQKDWFLDCVYVEEDKSESHRLVGKAAQFKNCVTGEDKVVSFDKMVFSLGPSAAVVMDPSLSDKDVVPASKSSVRDALNSLNNVVARGTMAHKGTMWAAGSSSVCMLGVKRGSAAGAKLDTFRKFIDGVNQHWTLIKEREVTVGDEVYDFFVLQMTGGGNFPSRHTKPDFVLNLMYTTEEIFGLKDSFEEGDVIYDIVQSRGCGRSVSARNTVGFQPIAKNLVSAYGLGGIGMTTAFANGALQLQILEALAPVGGEKDLPKGTAEGRIGSEASMAMMKQFYGDNIFSGVNYKAMVDDPQKVARAMGVDPSISAQEKKWYGYPAVGGLAATMLSMMIL